MGCLPYVAVRVVLREEEGCRLFFRNLYDNAMKYAIARGETTLGGFTKEEIFSKIKTGEILPSDNWYNVGTNSWEPITGLLQFFSIAANTPPPAPIQPKQVSSFNSCLIIGGALFFVFLVLVTVVGALNPSKDDDKPTPHLAQIYGQKLIEKHLKSPGTAQFSPDSDSDTFYQQRKDGDFYVGGWVDSQNGFGALIRTKWSAVVHYTPQSKYWTLVWFRLGDDES